MTTRFLIAGDLWWDGRRRTGEGLLVRDGVATPAPCPPGVVPVRLPGTLLPALRDAHVHTALGDAAALYAGGLAEVWDLGGVPAQVAELAGRAGRGGARLPRVRFAGPFLTASGGYPTDRSWAPAGSCREVRSAADAAEAVAVAVAGGATLIKATLHTGGPMLPPATLRAVVAAADAAGVPVVVHAEGPGTVAAAYESGAGLLAHTPWTGPLDPGLLRAAAARTTWISTLDIHRGAAREVAVGNLRAFREHGGGVRYGTDIGNGPLPLGVNPGEIRALQAAGLTPGEVLAAMTGAGEPGWLPAGLDLDPQRFADVLAGARVAGPEVSADR